MNLGEGAILNKRYRILRVLSNKGGMGVIYQAHDLNLNGTVVIKQSRFTEQEVRRQFPHLSANQIRNQAEYLRKAFEREAKLLFGLRHSALPRVIDYFATPDGNQFFVMEFIPGKDFAELLGDRLRQNQGPFPLDQVLGWAEQILDVLHYLHTNFDPPIIHRDIKPQNLKLMPNGQVILLDFGLAKGARSGMSVGKSILGGTPHYAPLEQINRKASQEKQTDPRCDIYSLAVTLHELLTGELPPDAVERVEAIAQGEPDPLRPAHELVPATLETVSAALQRAAAIFAKDRPATVAELRQFLRRTVTPMPPTIIVPQPETEPPTIVRTKHALSQSFSEDLGNGVKLEMIYIPGGSFLMGSPEDEGYENERPQHRVTLSPFYIGKYPITQAQWRAAMGNNPSHFKGIDLPVEQVTWDDAVKFCQAIRKRTGRTYRLPTEAEWEYSCRAGSIGQYCFGDGQSLLDQFAWFGNNAGVQRLDARKVWEEVGHEWEKYWGLIQKNDNKTHPVGQKKPNKFGLNDMHGNVWEWCQDWYDENYYAQSPETDPQGPESGEYRVLRGGSWSEDIDFCRSAYRHHEAPDVAYLAFGFRVVCIAGTQ
jgi:formylglycine-generating enzyme required for sulfatase activity